MAELTWYASYNGPNYSFIDGGGNFTTSISTTTSVAPLHLNNISVGEYYTYTYSTDKYNTRLNLNQMPGVTSVSLASDYVEMRGDSRTLGISAPSGYEFVADTHQSTYMNDVRGPNVTYTLEDGLYYRLKSYDGPITQSHIEYDYTQSTIYLVSNNASTPYFTGTSVNATALTSTDTLLPGASYSLYTTRIVTTNTGYRFRSSSSGNKTWYSSSYHFSTTDMLSESVEYSVDANNEYTQHGYTSSVSMYTNVVVLNGDVINETTWTQVINYFTATGSTKGIIADENGNVAYGSMSGLGTLVTLSGYPNYNYRPAVVTAFSKSTDISTVNTTWFGTFSTRRIDSGTSYTADTYIEYNNYGVGGTISSSTYTWHTFTRSEYSESSRTNNAYLYASGLGTYISVTIPVVNIISFKVSDNSCPFMSSVEKSITRTGLYDNGASYSSADSELVGTSSEMINNTLTSLYTTLNVRFYLTAFNHAVSVTNTYSTVDTTLSTSRSTTFLETTVTSSCDVTSFTNQNGYSYYTTFYGELANETFYNTSWVNSAVVSSSTISRRSFLTMSTIGYTNKTFGDIVNSTTIHDESTISSKVFRISLINNVVSDLFVESSTFKSVDVPMEYFRTGYTSWRNFTEYHTYMGPKITEDFRGRTSYNFDVTVTEIESYAGIDYIGEQESTSSTINTSAYGGTTYRLSDLISSSSWFNAGSVNGTVNYLYNYDVKSIFSLDDFITTLSNYSTELATSYSIGYDIQYDYDTYSVTKSSSLAARSTGERFIDRVEISRTSTIDYEVTNQIAIYNLSTMTTLSSNASSYNMQSEQDASTVARTFISSTADLATTSEVASSATATSARGSFIYSSRELVSSMTEQQNDTLIFASTFNTYSFYNSTYTTSTLNTVASTLSATTYEEWYNPISWTSTALSIATATSATETVNTTSGVVSVTQSVNYTPTYNDVDGIYVTTN